MNEAIDETTPAAATEEGSNLTKYAVLAALAAVIGGAYWRFGNAATFQWIAQQETALRGFQDSSPVLAYGAAFLAYVTVTGLSLPGAALMTVIMGWYFGALGGTVLVSFAATTGATIAFLLSRYLFRDAIQNRFGDRLQSFNEALEREGWFYLLTLRLIPYVPFFVVNVVMGLTKIRVGTYWWVSQVGMLAGTAIFCYAGSLIPDLQTLVNEGPAAAFSPGRVTQILVALTMLGVFPIIAKAAVGYFRARPSDEAA